MACTSDAITTKAGSSTSGTLSSLCVSVGFCDAPPPPLPPERIDVLCDHSVGSTCSREALATVVDLALAHLAPRPRSTLAITSLGKTLVETNVVADVTTGGAEAPLPPAWAPTTAAKLALAAAPMFESTPRNTPLAEGLTKVGLAGAGAAERYLVVISDLRERSLVDFECGVLPDDEKFQAIVQRAGALAPGSFAGVNVIFAFASMPAMDRCAVSLEREQQIRQRWHNAIKNAGAKSVVFTMGAPTIQ
jgi:hypothetical protein